VLCLLALFPATKLSLVSVDIHKHSTPAWNKLEVPPPGSITHRFPIGRPHDESEYSVHLKGDHFSAACSRGKLRLFLLYPKRFSEGSGWLKPYFSATRTEFNQPICSFPNIRVKWKKNLFSCVEKYTVHLSLHFPSLVFHFNVSFSHEDLNLRVYFPIHTRWNPAKRVCEGFIWVKAQVEVSMRYLCRITGGHPIAPKTASANAANAKARNRQMIGRPTIWLVRLS